MIFKKPKHQSDCMCQLPQRKPNIEKKKPNNFLAPTASKKSQICEIWRQKSQSGNPDCLCQITEDGIVTISAK